VPARTTKYLTRARAFAEAVEVGIAAYAASPPPDEDGLSHLPSAAYARETRKLARKALDPEPPFANVASLAYLEAAFFTFWNESTGSHVQRFWIEIAKRELPFARKDVIGAVLRRGRIRTRIEYEHVVDGMVILRQQRKISAAEERRLSEMIGEYKRRANA
jgi:hypothetical protein